MRRLAMMMACGCVSLAAHALDACAPPASLAALAQCRWECPDYRKGAAPEVPGRMKHVARCAPQAGKVASYFEGRLALTGHVQLVETVTWGEVLVFVPDAASQRQLPSPRQSSELWFANAVEARRLLAPPPLDARAPCRSAFARIVIEGLLTDLGDQDGNHDWVELRSVAERGRYHAGGCSMS